MRIYTRGGDNGQTGLPGGDRVSKADPTIAAVGDLDELNAFLGWAGVACAGTATDQRIELIQNELLEIGAWLTAAPQHESANRIAALGGSTERLEKEMDQQEESLSELRQFILPGGTAAGAALHVCRTVCRRVERSLVECLAHREREHASIVLAYLNRLSDWLFVTARTVNQQQGCSDPIWTKPF